jgi:hypothetical protein
VIKRKTGIVALACLLVLAAIVVSIPMTAMAAINTPGKWAVPVYQGTDSYYAADVIAFEAGTTAKLTVQVYNDQGVDVIIKEPKIILDWGATHLATVAPSLLKAGETGTVSFEVPVPATATNAVLHNYRVLVGYQRQDTNYVKSVDAGRLLGFGNGVTTVFNTTLFPVLGSSLKVYWRDTVPTPDTVTLRDPSTYVLDGRTGKITFGSAPALGIEVWADSQYFTSVGSGNGINKIFFTASSPVVDGSLKVYLGNAVTETWVEATGWTVDMETGKITLASAPSFLESVYVTYEYWTRWPVWSVTNFAVYSADQADAVALKVQFNDLDDQYPDYRIPGTSGEKAYEEAIVLRNQADAKYAAGDFAGAKTDYGAAIAKMQEAWGADTTINTGVETSLLGLLSSAEPVIDAFGAKLNAEAKQANGEASMYKNLGVFYIMLGVATLLAGIGGILWAYSRLVAAKGPKQL